MALPIDLHMLVAKRLRRYFSGILQYGLALHKCEVLDLTRFCDVDYASCPDDRRSTYAYCVYLSENLVSWHSSKQKVVSQSSIESEYRTMALVSAEIIWLGPF